MMFEVTIKDDPEAVVRRLSNEGVIRSLEVRRPGPGLTDLLFAINDEDMLVMVREGHDLVRLVGRLSETDLPATDLEQEIRARTR